jgi:hypothetical protein
MKSSAVSPPTSILCYFWLSDALSVRHAQSAVYVVHTRNNGQYSKTNVMRFLFNLLIIKCIYMFRALLAHLQEALNKRHLVYCVRVMSVGCYQGWSGTDLHLILNKLK